MLKLLNKGMQLRNIIWAVCMQLVVGCQKTMLKP